MTILGLALSSSLLSIYCLNVLLAYSAYPVLAVGRTNLAYVAFAAVGGYTMAVANKHGHWPLVVAAPLGLLFAGVIAAPLGRLLGRVSGTYLAIASLNVVVVADVLVVNLSHWTGGAGGLIGVPRVGHLALLTPVIACVAAAFAILERSGLGSGIAAQRTDALLAESVGVSTSQNVSIMFVISALVGALYGEMTVLFYGFATPDFFSFSTVILALAMVVLGGRASWVGPLIGATFFTILPEWLRSVGIWNDVVVAAVLLVVAIYAPEGVAGFVTRHVRLRRIRATAAAAARLEPAVTRGDL